jgi:D-glycero-D-manno-heptose 1,7-bisphosphate phosphatase
VSGRRAVFFDRDGVLNRAILRDGKPYPPANLDELDITEGAPEALAQLKERGFLLLVVTNQPDVSRGTQSIQAVEEIHRAIGQALPIDEFLVCPHDDRDGCACRKPKPGLLRNAAARYGIDLANSYLIGDRWRDVEAGQAAGCRTVWIDCGYRERGPANPPDVKVSSLNDAVSSILQHEWHN